MYMAEHLSRMQDVMGSNPAQGSSVLFFLGNSLAGLGVCICLALSHVHVHCAFFLYINVHVHVVITTCCIPDNWGLIYCAVSYNNNHL